MQRWGRNNMFAVLNNYKAQELGKAIINASGGLKLQEQEMN